MSNVVRFRPRVDLDGTASALLEALARSRGIDANVVADSFLAAHPDLRPADIIAACSLAGAVVASFQQVLLKQVESEGGAA
jgi:hypothetical protein